MPGPEPTGPLPPWFDARMPARDACVLRHRLDAAAARHPDRVFARFDDGSTWTYAETRRQARALAAGLRGAGVQRGDPVLCWLPNGPAMVRAWFGINYLGAVFAPVNTAYRGRLLAHVLANTQAKLLIGHDELLPRLDEVDRAMLARVVPASRLGELDGDGDGFDDPLPLEPWDIHAIIYTSGTTGPSKGVLQPYLQTWTTGRMAYGHMGPDDRILVNLPLFHVGGTTSIYGALAAGASFAVVESFSTQNFWTHLRATGSTTTSGLIGAMAEFLLKAPARADDTDNPLKIMVMTPINAQTVAFARRFGFAWFTGFNMTELSCPLIAPMNCEVPNTCGRARDGVQVRVVDEHDMDVLVGQPGELIVRADLPWTITPGYLNDPEATARAWRNGWFHTGDAVRRDADGNFFFVDRIKDAIRRRGENVSSLEVEAEAIAYPAVQEAAAVAVPSAHGEDEILLCVAARPGQTVEPRALVEFMRARMAHFMVPRYVRVLDALPKTPTNKVQKVELRRAGLTADTWDREAAGIVIKREKLSA